MRFRSLGPALGALALAGTLVAAVACWSAATAAELRVAQAAGPDEPVWAMIRDSADPQMFENFLARYPQSQHAADAQAKLDALRDRGGQMKVAPGAEPPAPPQNDLVAALQGELKRAGCYAGSADGNWGSKSRTALAAFASAAVLDVAGKAPSAGLLAELKSRPGPVCTSSASSPKPAGNKTATRPAAPAQSTAGCYDILVRVDTMTPGGEDWDPWPGKYKIVDPIVTETGTGATNTCIDSFACSVRVQSTARTFTFNIMDSDPDRADFVGAGSCQAGSSCRVGSALISMSRC